MEVGKAQDDIDFDFFSTERSEGPSTPSKTKWSSATNNISDSKVKEPPTRRSHSTSSESDRARSRSGDRHAYSDDSFDSDSDSESERKRSKRRNSSDSNESSDSQSRKSTARNGKPSKSGGKGGSRTASSSSSSGDDDDDDSRSASSRSSSVEESRTVSFSTTTMDSRSTSKKESRLNQSRQRTAWGEDDGYPRRRHDEDSSLMEGKPPRPSTAKPSDRKSKEKDRVKIPDQSRSRSRSHSGSDSEMTDVSPLPTPRDSPRQRRKHAAELDSDRSSVSRSRRTPQYRAIPLDGYVSADKALDLELLKSAVMDLEKQKRLKANTRRVMFEPPNSKGDRNYTFSKDRALFIERENQRLLGQILREHPEKQQQQKKAVPTSGSPVYRMTHSAVNRQREQRKIEMDNLAFLRRLQKVRPTRGMSRNEQIREYSGKMLFGAPYGALHEMQSRKIRSSAPTPAPQENSLQHSQRTRSMTSLHSAASSTCSRRSRSSRTPADARPPWNDRW